MVEVEQLHYVYPDGTSALEGIDARISNGAFAALIGQNGSGKTTFAKCLTGLLAPSSGTVRVDGVPTTEYRRKELASKVGYVFQNPDHQLFSRTVEREIRSGPEHLGFSSRAVEASFKESAAIAGVGEELFQQHPFFLSKGLRQRVAIASILAMKPGVIVVDEPTTGQDHRQAIAVMEFLRRLNEEQGHTVLIITHDMHVVARYAKRCLLFKDGRKVLDGATPEVFQEETLLDEARVKPPQVTRLSRETMGRAFLTLEAWFDALKKR